MIDLSWLHHSYLKIFLVAVGVTLLTTPFVRALAIRMGAMDLPSDVKVHKKATPRLGGLAIFLGFLFSLLFVESLSPQQKTIIMSAAFAHLIGILDDTRSVPAAVKLLSLFAITAFLAYRGIMLHLTPWLPVDLFLTLFWIVGVTSAFNAMDNMDGLAAGLTFFASLAYAYIAVQNNQWGWGALAVALMGSSLGFLFYNLPPASIFMGDSGSFFLGYSLAAISVMGVWSTHPLKAIAVPVFILGLPIFDLIYVVSKRHHHRITRSLRQIVTFSAKDHFSHRLVKLGLSQRSALFFMLAAGLALSLGAVSMRYVQKIEAILLCVQYVITILLIVFLMELIDQNTQKRKNDFD